MANRAKIFLIPNTLGEGSDAKAVFPAINTAIIKDLRHFAVEHVKDARRFLISIGLKELIDQSEFIELNKRSSNEEVNHLIQLAKEGHNIGLLSDAGCPGVADPGSDLVLLAHKNKIKVVPLIGPSSILLAMMSSGLNGQNFAFNGYLPRDPMKRNKQIKMLENRSNKENQSQLFMETPYRNESMWESLLKTLQNNTLLLVACDLSLSSEFTSCRSVESWKKEKNLALNKRPAIFGIHSPSE